MATTNVTLSYTKTGKVGGGTGGASPAAIVNASASDATLVQSFAANTFAAVTIPTGTAGVWIIPPPANAGNITVKGVTGDTGVLLGVLTAPFYLPLTAAASLGFLCANTTVLEFDWC